MATTEEVKAYLKNVMDPEIPVLSVMDMGVVRDVIHSDQGWKVTITPTYSGCPAMQTIESDILECLNAKLDEPVTVETVLRPAWTTDWMTDEGKARLREYGIAPPEDPTVDKRALMGETDAIACPNCGSKNTQMVSEFGSTACKSLFKCNDCLEPFDYFKCLR